MFLIVNSDYFLKQH